jgi:hypothetical protein
MTTFKIVFTLDVFFSAETMHCKVTCILYKKQAHFSQLFVYKYDQWPHGSYMTDRAGVWEADDIVKFYIALLDFFPATL